MGSDLERIGFILQLPSLFAVALTPAMYRNIYCQILLNCYMIRNFRNQKANVRCGNWLLENPDHTWLDRLQYELLIQFSSQPSLA